MIAFYNSRNAVYTTTIPPNTVPLDLEARLIHFVISSSILSALAGFSPQRQPFREPPFTVGFSIFSKHLFNDKLWRIEFCTKTICLATPSVTSFRFQEHKYNRSITMSHAFINQQVHCVNYKTGHPLHICKKYVLVFSYKYILLQYK